MSNLTYSAKYTYERSSTGIEIPIKLSLGGQEVRFQAKVDTGASFCFFQRDYAEQLGIDVESGLLLDAVTVNSRFVAYGHTIQMSCLDWEFDSTVYFFQDSHLERNVVGLTGWFDNFHFGLTHADSTVYLSHYNG